MFCKNFSTIQRKVLSSDLHGFKNAKSGVLCKKKIWVQILTINAMKIKNVFTEKDFLTSVKCILKAEHIQKRIQCVKKRFCMSNSLFQHFIVMCIVTHFYDGKNC